MDKQIYLGHKPNKDLMLPVSNGFVKGGGGLWTSTYKEEEISGWVQWCKMEEFYTHDNLDDLWLLTVNPEAKILVIDSEKDAEEIYKEFGFSLHGIMKGLDFVKISQQYDALNLTEEGQFRTRFTLENSFYGWDCESTHWFRWKFDAVEKMKGKIKT